MTELRDALRSALYDAFEAGWFDNHGSIADAWEDRAPEVMERPKVRAILALLDSSEPVETTDERQARIMLGVLTVFAQHGTSNADERGKVAIYADELTKCLTALYTSPTPTPDPEGG